MPSLKCMAIRSNRLVRKALFAVAAFASIPAIAADRLVGPAGVIDADTLEIRGTRLSLWGIAAPPPDQLCRNRSGEHYRCGQQAAHELRAFLDHRPVDCVVDRDRSRRAVAACTVAGVDLAQWLVSNGFSLDWPQVSKGAYAAGQAEASRANLGIWSGSFREPWRYRACRQAGGSPVACSDHQNDIAF
jgi:endonuclease YncB( thermonuclease family)